MYNILYVHIRERERDLLMHMWIREPVPKY